jgi:hypothetical protein
VVWADLHLDGDRLALFVQDRLSWLLTSRKWTAPLPINAYVVEHSNGLILFDTGQDRASVTNDSYFPDGFTGYLYDRLTRVPHRACPGTRNRASGEPGRVL